MRRLTEEQVRKILVKEVARYETCLETRRNISERLGVHETALSRALNGGHISGAILTWLGYRKVRSKFYEKVGS